MIVHITRDNLRDLLLLVNSIGLWILVGLSLAH